MRLRARNISFGQYARNVKLFRKMRVAFGVVIWLNVMLVVLEYPFLRDVWTNESGLVRAGGLLAVYWCCWHLLLIASLALHCRRHHYYLADLPWSKRGSWILLIPWIALPIGWVALLVSGSFLLYRKSRVKEEFFSYVEPEPPLPAFDLTIEFGVREGAGYDFLGELTARQHADLPDDNDGASPVQAGSRGHRTKTYHSSPKIARQQYVGLRTEWFQRNSTAELRKSESKLESQSDTVNGLKFDHATYLQEARRLHDKYGADSPKYLRVRELLASAAQELRDAQQVFNDLTVQHNTLLAGKPESVNIQLANDEFNQLLALPNVVAVQVVDEDVVVVVSPLIQYQGASYDGGDWELRFGTGVSGLYTNCLREGIKDSWYESQGHSAAAHPAYRSFRHDRTGFCFESREKDIAKLANGGQFLEAVSVAIECMHYVNPEDRSKIPLAFRRAI